MRSLASALAELGTLHEDPRFVRAKNAATVPPARVLVRAGVGATTLNIVGLLLGLLTGVLLALGHFDAALVTIILSSAADGLDGPVAREKGVASPFGAYLDSTLDRYVDSAIFVGIALFYSGVGDSLTTLMALLALVGASITSYTAARAGSLGVHRHVGLIGRPHRLFLLIVGVARPALLPEMMWVLAILGNLTAIQRTIYYLTALRATPEATENHPLDRGTDQKS